MVSVTLLLTSHDTPGKGFGCKIEMTSTKSSNDVRSLQTYLFVNYYDVISKLSFFVTWYCSKLASFSKQ